jgi:hypothetical protein
MALLVSIVLAVLALAFVLYPLLHRAPNNENEEGKGIRGRDRGGKATPPSPVPTSAVPLAHDSSEGLDSSSDIERASDVEREQAARDALREVELDFQLGNIAEQDYRRLRERYVQRALVALKSRYDREQELDALIEDQLRKLKEQEHDAT